MTPCHDRVGGSGPGPLGERIVALARFYIDTPFYHAGRSHHGLDCIGLLAVVAHELAITDFDDVNYSALGPPADYLTAVLGRYARVLARCGKEDAPLAELEPGDLVQFDIAGVPSHCGVYARDERGGPTVIHAYQAAGRVLEHPFDRHWQRRLWAAYRVEERS
jgi:cell wall-associated NlpC family hydrolase